MSQSLGSVNLTLRYFPLQGKSRDEIFLDLGCAFSPRTGILIEKDRGTQMNNVAVAAHGFAIPNPGSPAVCRSGRQGGKEVFSL